MGNLDVITALKERKVLIDGEIAKSFFGNKPSELYDLMADYPSRKGKGLRPGLCMLACETFGGDPSKAIRSAAAFELFHDFACVHDDIQDGSDERRGKPALHHIHGIPMALNAGDGLYTKAFELFIKNKEILGETKTFEILDEFVRTSLSTVEGQAMEINWVTNKIWDLTEKDYFNMCSRKTSEYTINGPFRMGAIIAGATQETLQPLMRFGILLGVAFQIQDDVLNLVADKAKYGKEIAGDIYEGKRTLILINLLNNCTPEEKEKVITIIDTKRKKKKKKDVRYVLGLMKKYGSIKYAKGESKKYAEEAKGIFDAGLRDIPENDAKKTIRSLIDFVIEREY